MESGVNRNLISKRENMSNSLQLLSFLFVVLLYLLIR